jgi:hypothetical protein
VRLKGISSWSSVANAKEQQISPLAVASLRNSVGMTKGTVAVIWNAGRNDRVIRLLESSATAGRTDVVEGDGAGAEKNQGEGESRKGQGELISVLAQETVVKVNFGDGDTEIEADGGAGDASEEADQDQEASEKLSEGGQIRRPDGKPQADDELDMVVQAAENLLVSVTEHDSAQSEAHDKEGEGLQAIEVVQGNPPAM